tara:strand:+ start:303 stop:974 length:672 start_codon:yes stop_codon:yes gene_type:complete
MKLNLRPILGTEVGLSLAIMQATAHHEITPSLVLCDLAISHSIYGRDRLNDQLICLKGQDNEGEIYKIFNYTTSIANLIAFLFLLKFECTECIPIVSFLSNAYSISKVGLGNTKPFLIGILWAYAIVFLPPDEVPNDLFLVYFSLYAATSNIADIKDIEKDKENGIITIPVKFGEKATYIVSAVLASVALATHTNFDDWTIGDTFIEIVSVGLFLYSSVMSFC